MNNETKNEVVEDQVEDMNEQIKVRREKLAALREAGNAYPNYFRRDSLSADLYEKFETKTNEDFETNPVKVAIAGRVMSRRIMGKASFVNIQDMSGRIQLYLMRDRLPEGVYQNFKGWDIGDIVGVRGELFKTKTNELTVKADTIELLTKALRPLPDKFHGLTDVEQRYRQRYIDIMVNQDSRNVFIMRSKIVASIREFLANKGFMEVETPMMQPQAGGAAARPFVTHHNSMDMDLCMRIAPELYLKRLVVGGFEKVFEINRNFRNEGISTKHNPEFTMLEFYEAYADYHDLMTKTEELFKHLASSLLGKTSMEYQGETIHMDKPFARMTMVESILKYNIEISREELDDLDKAKALCAKHKIHLRDNDGLGKIHMELFEELVEDKLIEPTFITEHPCEVSPLARKSNDNDFIADRFEFFVAGKEIANGFSELNDPDDQAARFKAQMESKAAGDDEAMPYDEDYITALEYGLPPTAGEGIGIDRLVMLFTDSASIRDVILFPLLRNK